MQGKIIKGIAGFYYVHDGHSRIYECKAKGSFRNQKIKPLVGDDVEFTILSGEEGTGTIRDILPRKNFLIRPAVANIDQALILFAAKEPTPNFNLLDRFLIMMERQEVPCLICFNKEDLADDEWLSKLRFIYESAGYPVYFLSAREKRGLDPVRALIQNKTTALAGPSGVGKSSLTNLLVPEANMETGGLSEKIKRGKHTTRHSELFFAGENTYMMDTPGFSSIDVSAVLPEDLREYFPEYREYEGSCRFLGCHHMSEPDCRVKEAIAAGTLSKERYETYTLLYEELKQKKRY